MKKFLIVIAVLALGWFIASPYVAVQQMKSAAEDRDGEALSDHIEFPTLRQNFKDQLNAAMAQEMSKEVDDNLFAAFGAALGTMMVDGMVDAYVTPAGITQMMKGESPNESEGSSMPQQNTENNAFEDAVLSYESWDKFSISVPNEKGEVSKFILRRRGIGWKLTNIVIPLEN